MNTLTAHKIGHARYIKKAQLTPHEIETLTTGATIERDGIIVKRTVSTSGKVFFPARLAAGQAWQK